VFVPLWQPASDIFLYACAYFEANKYDDDDDDRLFNTVGALSAKPGCRKQAWQAIMCTLAEFSGRSVQ